MYKITKAIVLIPLLCLGLSACDGDEKQANTQEPIIPEPVTPEPVTPKPVIPNPNKTSTLSEADGTGIELTQRFMALDSEQVDKGIIVPQARTQSQGQELLSKSYDELPMPDLWEYQQLLPKPELFCQEPSSQEFLNIAEQLGGFKKTSSIRIEKDASAPYLLDGIEPYRYLEEDSKETSSNAGNVTIQRPDVLAKKGDKAFYLSNTYGLIYMDLSGLPAEKPTYSCALPLPGNAKNFVVTDDSLIVLSSDFKSKKSAILQFSIAGDTPEYVSSILVEDSNILDARLFNDTLAVYLEAYATSTDEDYSYRKVMSHQLQIIETQPNLTIKHSEVLLPEGEKDTAAINEDEQEKDNKWTYFNQFLSASGEYLLVSQSIHKSIFTGYETYNQYRCTKREQRQYPYTYCNTVWERQENPAYVAPSPIGTMACSGDLSSCLKKQAPSINKYIYVATGKECHNSIRYESYCSEGHYQSYQVPQYRQEEETQFIAYHFADEQFTKLEDKLATVIEDGNGPSIQATEQAFIVEGLVRKHDHLHFIDDRFYAITKQNNNEVALHTLSIQGNAAIYINKLILNQSESVYNLAAKFTEQSIYLSDSGRYENSDLQTISLSEPLKPTISHKINIPTKLDQLMFANSSLLGFGRSSVEIGNDINNNLGTITAFNADGIEQNSLLLGTEYRFFSSNIYNDDQVLNIDAQNERVLYPYSVSSPLEDDLPYLSHRLTLADFAGQTISQEHTFELPQLPERTLSISKESALAFSNQMIHSFANNGEWQQALVFDGLLPQSIYYSREFPTQVQKVVSSNQFHFNLIKSADAANGELLDSISIAKASSRVCSREQVYFDQDRILIVQEKPNTYHTYQDCPSDLSTAEKVLTAYKIKETKFELMTEQNELQALYDLIQLNVYCVTDINNKNGKVIKTLPDDIDDMKCLSAKHYYSLRDQ